MPDVYGSTRAGGTPWLARFEEEIAAKLGKEAAIWVPSGTMAQGIVLCCAQKVKLGIDRTPALPRLRRPFFAHPTSHLLLWEEEAHQRLLDIPCITVGAKDRPLVSADLDVALNAAMDLASGPAALILEVPQREIGGETTPWTEIKKLRQLCSEQRVWMHMDGARLWEILPFYEDTHGVGCHELLSMFDSVYVSFYKGLGSSLPGAVLAGDAAFVSEARVWLRRFGGNLYTAMPVALSALDSFRREEGTFREKWKTMEQFVLAVQQAVAALPELGDGDSEYVRFTPPIPECGMCHCHILGEKSAIEAACERTAVDTGMRIFRSLRGDSILGPKWQYFEWSIGPVNSMNSPSDIRKAWQHFLICLHEKKASDPGDPPAT